jgi:hypothetical protein
VNGSYPAFRSSYSHEDLVEHFLLTPAELSLLLKCRGIYRDLALADVSPEYQEASEGISTPVVLLRPIAVSLV